MTADQPQAAHKAKSLVRQRRVPFAGALLSLAAFLAGVITYTGSSLFEPGTHGFRIGKNMISDLGVTSAYRGEPMTLSNALFVIALISLAIGLTSYSFQVVKSHALTMLICLASVLLIAVGFTPSDISGELHNYLFFAATGLSAIWLLGYGKECHSRSATGLGILLLGYATFLALSPRPASSVEWRFIHSNLEIAMLVLILVWLLVTTTIHVRKD